MLYLNSEWPEFTQIACDTNKLKHQGVQFSMI